jgi:phenylacetate-CoA ligase
LNEEDNVDLLVERVCRTFDEVPVRGQLVLIDDGSTDATWERIEAHVRASDRVTGVRHDANRGIEGSWRTGLEHAAAPLVCLIDSDLQNRPEDIARLYRAYRDKSCDLVQAVRHPTQDRTRIFFSRALNLLLNATFRMKLRDSKSGFVMCRREVLADILEHRFRYRYYQSFIGVAASVRGYRIEEVDTDFERRHAGSSFLSSVPVVPSLRILVELAKFRTETLLEARRRTGESADS